MKSLYCVNYVRWTQTATEPLVWKARAQLWVQHHLHLLLGHHYYKNFWNSRYVNRKRTSVLSFSKVVISGECDRRGHSIAWFHNLGIQTGLCQWVLRDVVFSNALVDQPQPRIPWWLDYESLWQLSFLFLVALKFFQKLAGPLKTPILATYVRLMIPHVRTSVMKMPRGYYTQ